MTQYLNWNSLSAGTLTIGLQLWMFHQLPGLPMELMTVVTTAIGIVWIAAGIQWVTLSEQFVVAEILLLRMLFVTNFGLAFWFAAIQSLRHVQ